MGMWVVVKPLRGEADLLGSRSVLGEVAFCSDRGSSHHMRSAYINFELAPCIIPCFPFWQFCPLLRGGEHRRVEEKKSN